MFKSLKIIILCCLFSTSFFLYGKDIKKNFIWYSSKVVYENFDKLEAGDILVFSKRPTPLGIWGHVAVLNKNKNIVEFPSYFYGYVETLFKQTILPRKGDIAILRLKDIDNELKEELFKEIYKTIPKTYGITFNKDFDKRLYCSQFIYIIFKKAGENLGRNINLDYNGGKFVTPYDILQSPLLENIKFE